MNFLNKTQATIKCGEIFQVWIEQPVHKMNKINFVNDDDEPRTSKRMCQINRRIMNKERKKKEEGRIHPNIRIQAKGASAKIKRKI